MTTSTVDIEKVKSLRQALDAPYQDCVKALKETNGDFDKASQWLKEKGKATQREASVECGTIGYYEGEDSVSLIVVKCETDFVAINEDFIRLVNNLAKDLNTGNEEEAYNTFKEAAWIFKENIEVGAHLKVNNNDSHRVTYVHHNRTRATVLRYKGDVKADDVALRIAMQACAMRPQYLNRSEMNPAELAELQLKAKEEAIQSGKPENIADRIAEGKVNNALKDIVLLEQSMFDEPKITAGQLAEKSSIEIVMFVNVIIG